jgi:N,N'-diacetyllegionaminate synthase
MEQKIILNGKTVGSGEPCFLIAEVAQAHDGSLGMAHAYIDAAADAGVDAIKFQTHIADAESTFDEPFRVRFSRQDETRFDYWRRMEFSLEQWVGLAEHARKRNLLFLSSPFSLAAVDLLRQLGVNAWKIGSGEVSSWDMIEAICEAGGPILLSTGMSDLDSIQETVSFVRERGAEIALFQCTSRYPVKLTEVGLNVIDLLKYSFNCPVGLSDHSGTVFPALAAMARGASLIEAHIVFDRVMFGPDAPSSLTPAEFKLLANARDSFIEMLSNPVDKDALAAELSPIRAMFGKSAATVRDVPAGTVLTRDILTFKKPANGIPASELGKLVGSRLKKDVSSRQLLTWDDLDV